MKTKLFLAAMAISMAAYSQKLHRYVLEVETTPEWIEYETRRLPNGNITQKRVSPQKTVEYWEVISPVPLTTQQLVDSINAGKAKRVPAPQPKVDYSKVYQDNLTMDGDIEGSIWDRDPYDGEMHYEDPDLYELIAD